ncbi:MAG: O-antigen polymerase [Thermoleophilia bacterium]|nr:O-antigen polymerase [Thermoleophilia bacterium]
MTSGWELVATIAACAGGIGALARTTTRAKVHAAGLPLLLSSWAVLLLAIAPERVHDRWPIALAAVAVGALVLLGLGRLVTGRETWLLAAGAAVLTLRIPVPTGDDTAMLLLPLYAVLALGAASRTRVELARLRAGIATGGRLPHRGGATRLLDVGAALLPLVAAASLAWSTDGEASAVTLGCFLVPFVIAYWLVRGWVEEGAALRPAGWALVASTLLAAGVGVYQVLAREVWWNPKVIDANRFRADFRTNSLYWDPNIYGRALVVGACVLVACLLIERLTRWRAALACAALALLTVALWNTYSQSSWVALAGALIVVAVLTLPPHPRRWVAGALVAVMLAASPSAYRALSGSDSSGRADVVRSGIALASERPIAGWGVGTFETAVTDRARRRGTATPTLTASHTTPVTVIAELGILGAAAYLVLLTSAATAVLARWRHTSTPASAARAAGDPHATGWPIAPVIWASAVLAALVAHSLLYAGFFEDATLWVALALLASLPRSERPTPEPV